MKIDKLWILFVGLVFVVAGYPCWAEDNYPNKPIELIIAYPAGGVVDLVSRVLGDKIREYLGQPILAINKPGGQGSVAAGDVINAKPDGYTLLATTAGWTTSILFTPSLPYNHTQLRAIGSPGFLTQLLCVSKDLPIKNLAELVDYARKNPGTFSIAVIGKGRAYYVFEFLKLKNQLTDAQLQVIPHQGDMPALMALLGKHVQAGITDHGTGGPHLRSGEIRVIAVLSKRRDPILPDVSTGGEQGLPEMDNAPPKSLYFAPSKTPDPIVKKLESAMEKALQDKEVREKLTRIAFTIDSMNSKDTDEWVNRDYKIWSDLVSSMKKEGLTGK
jgi:tripartite-type tricarboxylate transporter receptor subunit TctC